MTRYSPQFLDNLESGDRLVQVGVPCLLDECCGRLYLQPRQLVRSSTCSTLIVFDNMLPVKVRHRRGGSISHWMLNHAGQQRHLIEIWRAKKPCPVPCRRIQMCIKLQVGKQRIVTSVPSRDRRIQTGAGFKRCQNNWRFLWIHLFLVTCHVP